MIEYSYAQSVSQICHTVTVLQTRQAYYCLTAQKQRPCKAWCIACARASSAAVFQGGSPSRPCCRRHFCSCIMHAFPLKLMIPFLSRGQGPNMLCHISP